MLTATVSYLRSVDWRALWHEPIIQALVSLFWLVSLLAPALAIFVPPTFHLLPRTYIVWMVGAIIVGVIVSARWWMTWLVGTLLWSLLWLNLYLWLM